MDFSAAATISKLSSFLKGRNNQDVRKKFILRPVSEFQ